MKKEDLDKIERQVAAYRQQLIKEQEAVDDYIKRIGMPPCCAKKALTGSCLCWQDSWC